MHENLETKGNQIYHRNGRKEREGELEVNADRPGLSQRDLRNSSEQKSLLELSNHKSHSKRDTRIQ